MHAATGAAEIAASSSSEEEKIASSLVVDVDVTVTLAFVKSMHGPFPMRIRGNVRGASPTADDLMSDIECGQGIKEGTVTVTRDVSPLEPSAVLQQHDTIVASIAADGPRVIPDALGFRHQALLRPMDEATSVVVRSILTDFLAKKVRPWARDTNIWICLNERRALTVQERAACTGMADINIICRCCSRQEAQALVLGLAAADSVVWLNASVSDAKFMVLADQSSASRIPLSSWFTSITPDVLAALPVEPDVTLKFSFSVDSAAAYDCEASIKAVARRAAQVLFWMCNTLTGWQVMPSTRRHGNFASELLKAVVDDPRVIIPARSCGDSETGPE